MKDIIIIGAMAVFGLLFVIGCKIIEASWMYLVGRTVVTYLGW